jgi:hypothetical protein
MAKTIAISQIGGSIAGSGGASTPANVTVGTITYDYAWNDGQQSSARRPTSLRLHVPYTRPGGWTGTGVHVYVEYPDASAKPAFTLDGTSPLDGTSTALGGRWSPQDLGERADDGTGVVTFDLIAIPDKTVNIRVYLVAYNALSDPPVQRATSLTPSPSGVVTVQPPPTFALGTENAAPVTDLAAFTQYAVNSSGQLVLQLFVSWTEPDDPNFQGVFLTMHRPAQTVTAPPGTRVGTLQANALDVNSGLLVGTSWTHELSQFPTTAEFDTLYALSVDIAGNVNSIVVGTTPQVTVEIDPPPNGTSGQEFTSLVTNFQASVVYNTTVDGAEQYGFAGSLTTPNDPSFGGYVIVLHNQADGSDHTNDINATGEFGPNDTTWKTPFWGIDGGTPTWDVYCVSYDVNNQPNTLVPGTTPRVTGLHPVAQTAGSLKATRLSTTTYSTTRFGIGSGAFDINNASISNALMAALSIAQSNIQNAAVGTPQIAAASITTALIANAAITSALIANLAVGTAAIQNLAVTTAKIANLAVTDAQINDLSATKITAGTIAAVTITTATINGGAITGTTLSLLANGLTTTLNNATTSGWAYGIKVVNNTDGSYAGLNSGALNIINSSGQTAFSASQAGGALVSVSSASGVDKVVLDGQTTDGQVFVYDSGGTIRVTLDGAGAVKISGTQVLSSRQTDPGVPSFSSVSDAQTWCANLRTALRNHGLI